MTKRSKVRPDHDITHAVHRLFIQATLQDPFGVIVCFLTRIPALILNNVFIPLEIAYGLQAIFTRQFDKVPHYVFTILLLAIGYAVLSAIGGIVISRNGVIGSSYVQRSVFTNFLQKDYDFYGNTYFGALGSQAVRLRDVYNDYCLIFTLNGPTQFVTIIAGIIVVAWKSPLLALVTLLTMSLVLGFTVIISKLRLPFRRRVSTTSNVLAGAVGDALTHGQTVKSFASTAYEEENLALPLRNWGTAQFKTWVSAVPADTGRTILAATAMCILLYMAAHMYQRHQISIAVVALVQLYVIKMIAATQSVAEIIKQYEVVMDSAYETLKTMLIKPTVVDPSTPKQLPKGALTIGFHGVSFYYSDAKEQTKAITDFDLTINPGEKIGLVGYSGSGKTTLTKLILRFMDTTEGSITLNNVDIRDMTQQKLREQIAYVPQEPLLFHRSVAENIAYGRPSAPQEDIEQAAKSAYVNEFAIDLPQQYDTLVGERGVKLSGGQRQRVAIARAILKNAPILVLDEATSALDSRSEKFIQEALWRLMKGRTALVVAHRLSTIQRMDRIVVMNKGKIVQIGSHEELLKDKKGIYAELWSHQSGGYVGAPASKDS